VRAPRPLPWTALIEALGEPRFEEIRSALARTHTDPLDRDAFLLNAGVGQVFRDLVPADAPAEAVTSYGALLHAIYAHWDRGSPVFSLDAATAARLLSAPPAAPGTWGGPAVCYVQLPERLVWAASDSGAAHEPMDGLFAIVTGSRLRVLAVLGFRPDRQGFTTLEADLGLPSPPPVPRADGSAPFATALPAGDRMGFFSVTSDVELAALALLALAGSHG
jgi:hypothetical protein